MMEYEDKELSDDGCLVFIMENVLMEFGKGHELEKLGQLVLEVF
jgi:hypothetical protein